MQLEQQETFRIEGPQLELLGQAESKLPAPARKRPMAAAAIVLAAVLAVFGIGGAKLSGAYRSTRAIYASANEHGQGMANDLALRADAAANLIRLCAQKLGDSRTPPSRRRGRRWTPGTPPTRTIPPISSPPTRRWAAPSPPWCSRPRTPPAAAMPSTASIPNFFPGRTSSCARRPTSTTPPPSPLTIPSPALPASLIGALWGVGEVELFQ